MKIGMIGLGRMGGNMVRRLLKNKHEVVIYDRSIDSVKTIEKEGAIASNSIEEMIQKLDKKRIVWIMLPAGKPVENTIDELSKLMEENDIIIEGGNSYYKDDIRRSDSLVPRGIKYVDIGVSGGIWGLKIGYCMMIGGDKKDFEYVEPVLKSLAPPEGYLYCGPTGAGHFVKMIHNGIEYALMEAYGEGFQILESSPYGKELDYKKVSHLWNQGSVIRSWLLELMEDAFEKDPKLDKIEGYVEDSGEGRWTVHEAIDFNVNATTIAHALFKRFSSRQQDSFSDKVVAALRDEFGGHGVKNK